MTHPRQFSLGFPAAALLLASGVLAQPALHIRGQVEASQVSTCYYCPTITSFVLHGTETPIHSSTIDFNTLLGANVLLTGSWGGTPTVPVFEATAYQLISSQFSLNGNSSFGNTVRFNASAPSGDIVANLIALNAGVLTLSPDATFLLNPAQAAILDAGIATGGLFRTDFPIPNNPTLVGLHFFGQALVVPASGAPMYTTEADSKRVQ